MRQRSSRVAALTLLLGAALVAAPHTGGGLAALGSDSGVAASPRAAQTPAAVTNLAARAISSRRIELTFAAPAVASGSQAPATRYLVKQSRLPLTAATFASAQTLCGGTCSFSVSRRGDTVRLTVEDLVPNRLYSYALRPLDSAGRQGPLSNIASARTQRDRIRPGRPAGLSARAVGGRRIRLRFRAPGSDGRRGPPVRRFVVKQSVRPITSARGFRRARALCRSSCRFAPARRGSRLSLSVRRLCPGRRYYYAIRAKDEGGNLSRIARFRPVTAKGRGGVICL